MTQISSLTLRRATDESQMVASMLELARAADIKAACPRSDTFCLPRVKCPVKFVMYDREAQRFMEGVDKVIIQSIHSKCYFSSPLCRVLIYFKRFFFIRIVYANLLCFKMIFVLSYTMFHVRKFKFSNVISCINLISLF